MNANFDRYYYQQDHNEARLPLWYQPEPRPEISEKLATQRKLAEIIRSCRVCESIKDHRGYVLTGKTFLSANIPICQITTELDEGMISQKVTIRRVKGLERNKLYFYIHIGNLVYDVKFGSINNRAKVIQWWRNEDKNQQWKITKTSDGYFTFMNRKSRKFLTSEDQKIVQREETKQQDQKFKL